MSFCQSIGLTTKSVTLSSKPDLTLLGKSALAKTTISRSNSISSTTAIVADSELDISNIRISMSAIDSGNLGMAVTLIFSGLSLR
ncbi:MAG: hypothetical protein ACFBSE_22535 [Prochloraceae cyanobacterium]